jgi:hypothetical protein
MLHMRDKDVDAARHEIDYALEAAPADPRCLYALLAWHRFRARVSGAPDAAVQDAAPPCSFFEGGRLDEALAAIERAMALVPETVKAPSVMEHRRAILDALRRAAAGP